MFIIRFNLIFLLLDVLDTLLLQKVSFFSGFDIPLDAFSLHHPFLQPHVQEFEFSDWYFLFFTLFYKNVSASPAATADVSMLVPELAKALSSKLSVPANIFTISKAEKYRQVIFSENIGDLKKIPRKAGVKKFRAKLQSKKTFISFKVFS